MALGTATVAESSGRAPSRLVSVERLTFLADDAYAAGGTAAFQAYVQAALGRTVNILHVDGYTAAAAPATAIVHKVVYDHATDKLQLFVAATAAEAAAADLSANTVHCTIICE